MTWGLTRQWQAKEGEGEAIRATWDNSTHTYLHQQEDYPYPVRPEGPASKKVSVVRACAVDHHLQDEGALGH